MSIRRLGTWLAGALVVLAATAGAAGAAPAYVQVAGSPFAGTFDAWAAAFSPGGAFFATGAFFDNAVQIYAVSSATGSLTPVGGKPTGSEPNAIAFAKHGSTTYLGVATGGGAVLFSVSASGGLTQLGAIAPSVNGPTSIDFNSTGTLVAEGTYSGVQMYSVGATGLTAIGSLVPTTSVSSVAFSPNGQFLAVALQNFNRIQMFSVGSGGSLTAIGLPTATGNSPDSVAFSPNGKQLAVADQGDNHVGMYSVGSTGALTAAGSGGSTDSSPDSVAFSHNGKLVAASNIQGDSVSLFAVGSGGALTPVSGSPLQTGVNSHPDAVAFSPTGLLAAPHSGVGISVFAPAPPSVRISSPSATPVLARGASVRTRFSCADSIFGPGLASCSDSNRSRSPGGHLSTTTLGAHTYLVTARSRDGQSSTARLRYTVFNAPSVKISAPHGGRTYRLRARVHTKFSCHEGAGAPGLVMCTDATGASSGRGRLNTSHYGLFHYVVTAVSRDTLVVHRSISFRVAARPSAFISSPFAGGTYGRGARVLASYKCHDGLGGSGIKSCHGSVKNGKPIDTSSSGRHRFVVAVRSKDGLRARVSVSYIVR